MARNNPINRTELLKSLLEGPAFMSGPEAAQYRLWMTTWILPKLAQLDEKLDQEVREGRIDYMTSEDQRWKLTQPTRR